MIKIEGQFDILKDSIMYKAFRGELGTSDPNEESALEFLKEILNEKGELISPPFCFIHIH